MDLITKMEISHFKLASQDIFEGLKSWRIWLLLARQDIQLRYRRSTLGPFWITLSIAITIGSIGFLYGKLFHRDLATYYPYFAAGLLSWSLISVSLTDATQIFVESEQFIRQMKQPYTTFVFRVVCRNFIIFLHHLLIFIPIILFSHLRLNLPALWSLWGLTLIVVNAVSVGTLLAIFGVRFRDVTQVINSMIQVIFFLTPIMWSPDLLPPNYQFAVSINPVAQLIELVRDPLLGHMPSVHAFLFSNWLTAVNLIVAFIVFSRFRARIAYWV